MTHPYGPAVRLLDQGKAQGVKIGLPVLAPQGIVGRIVEAFPQYSKVLFIVDRKSGADAMVQRTRIARHPPGQRRKPLLPGICPQKTRISKREI